MTWFGFCRPVVGAGGCNDVRVTDASPDIHPLPQAAPWVPPALFAFALVSLLLMAASWWNPWRLLILDDHDLALTAVGFVGCCAFVVALWLTMPRGWSRLAVLPVLSLALGLAGLGLLLLAPFVAAGVQSTTRIASVDHGSIHEVHHNGFLSGCRQFEVRDESGWFTRRREFGVCLNDERSPVTASTDGAQLTVTVGDQICVYDVDAAAMRVRPVDPACDVLDVLRSTA